MPYEYRKLSPEQRREVLKQRAENGYPLHTPPHPFRQAGYYLITAANYEHASIMEQSDRRTAFEELLLKAIQSIGAEMVAWVILPNHYHFLAGVENLNQISIMLRDLHGTSAYRWNREDHQQRRKVWYHFADRYLRNMKQYFQAINYIHINPIKHRYVSDPYAWQWSSLELYYCDMGQEWLRSTWQQYPPPRGNWME